MNAETMDVGGFQCVAHEYHFGPNRFFASTIIEQIRDRGKARIQARTRQLDQLRVVKCGATLSALSTPWRLPFRRCVPLAAPARHESASFRAQPRICRKPGERA